MTTIIFRTDTHAAAGPTGDENLTAETQSKASSSSPYSWRRSTWAWLAGLLLVCVALRAFLLLTTDPILSPDSRSYMQLAQQIAARDLSADSGLRTPIYPLFLALLGNDPTLVRLVQMGLGLVITALMFWLGRRTTGNDVAATAIAAGYGLSLSQIFFESNVLTETLTTFGVTLSVIALLMALARLDEGRWPFAWVAALGITSALTALVRPSFLFLPVLLTGVLFFKVLAVPKPRPPADGTGGIPARERALRGASKTPAPWRSSSTGGWLFVLALLPAVIVIGGWSAFNYMRFGYFGPSTITGFTLTDHSIGFIEYAPDRYAVIRDTYLDLRRQDGVQYVSVWRGVEPLKERLGLTTAQLSQQLTRMSLELFARQPLLYARSVWITWVQFWNAYGGYHGVVAWPGARDPTLALFLGYLFRAMKYIYIVFNAFFLAWTAAITITPRRLGRVPVSLLVMAAVVLITSLLSSATQGGGLTAGGSNRYAMPVQPLLVCVVIAEGFHLVARIRSRSARTSSLLRPIK